MRALLFVMLLGGCAGSVGEAPKLLRSAIEEQQDTLDQCYAKNLKSDASGKGDMELVLHVVADGGRVESVKVTSNEIDDPKLAKCVTKTLQAVTIDPAPSADFDIDYELQFGSGSEKKKPKAGDDSDGDSDDKPAKQKPAKKKPAKKPDADDSTDDDN